jgi:hypothetical protein
MSEEKNKDFTGGAPLGAVSIRTAPRGGQGGGKEMPPGTLGAPLRRTPTTPHGPTIGAFATDISPSVKAALAAGPSERAERVRAVVARKR